MKQKNQSGKEEMSDPAFYEHYELSNDQCWSRLDNVGDPLHVSTFQDLKTGYFV